MTESMVNADRSHAGLVVGRLVRVALVTGANIGLAIIVTAIVLLLLLALFLSARRKTAQPSGARPRSSGATPRRTESKSVSQAAPAAVDAAFSESRVPNETASEAEGAPAMSDTGGMETWADAPSANGHDPLVAVGSLSPTEVPVADELEPLPVGSTASQETFSWSMTEEWGRETPSMQGLTEPRSGADQQVTADPRPDSSFQGATALSQLDRESPNVLVLEGNEYVGGGGVDTMAKSKGVTTGGSKRVPAASRAAKSSGPEITVSAVPDASGQLGSDTDESNDDSLRIPDDHPQGAEQQPVADAAFPMSETHSRVDNALQMARSLDETLRGLAEEMATADSQNRAMTDRLRSMEESSQELVAFRDSLRGHVSAATAADDLTEVQELVTSVVESPNNLMVLLRLYEQSQRLSTVVQEYADLRRLIQSDGFPAA
ncbi:MAG: hypothetical protein M3Z66_12905 [Chloroflexota bacterium]|nr:hypothetical protein [Chloroflexota bacterium]